MKLKILIGVLVVVLIGAVVYVLYGDKNTVGSLSTTKTDTVMVDPQEARDGVTVNEAMLSDGGYVVIRGSDGKRLGQIIEVSAYLEPGEHKNVQIALGDFYTYKPEDQLIAMIYKDDGDKAFSEADQPVTDPTGALIARFVKTGQPVPTSVTQEVMVASGGMGMETVRYTNAGFSPKKLTVPIGTMVEFVNQSDSDMWVASNVHPSHDILPTFDEFKGVGKGQTYMYTFDKKGTWPYHDHINPAREGIIEVI